MDHHELNENMAIMKQVGSEAELNMLRAQIKFNAADAEYKERVEEELIAWDAAHDAASARERAGTRRDVLSQEFGIALSNLKGNYLKHNKEVMSRVLKGSQQ